MSTRPLPQFCYIVVTDGQNCLAESTYVSSAFLRRLYPTAEITILTDTLTKSVIANKAFRFEDHTAKVHAIPVDSQHRTPAERSRFLKTQLRKWIEGDLVFLDADALPFRQFDELFTTDHTVACVLDRNVEFPKPHMPVWVKPMYEHFGWPYPLSQYFNTGVLYLADNSNAHALGKLWHERWKETLSQFGKHHDQPSFNSALNALEVDVKCLPVQFNAMVEASPHYARRARIVHYFLHGKSRQLDPESLLAHLVNEVRETGTFDWKRIDRLWKRGEPWVSPCASFHRSLAMGHYLQAAQIGSHRLLKRPALADSHPAG